MSEKLVTLATFTYTTETIMLVAKLEAEGITCVLGNEHLVSTQPLLSNAIGGINVNVREDDYQKAHQLFEEYEAEKKQQVEMENTLLGKDYVKVHTFCPKCESSEVFRKKNSILSLSLFGSKEHTCAECGFQWKQ